MLQVLEESSKNIFVPLCVGGGIQDYEDEEGQTHSALDVATCLFRAGADKVSIGSAVRECLRPCVRVCDR
jgi:glutamine amidotransferase/cyclase